MPLGQKKFDMELLLGDGNPEDPKRDRSGSCVEFYQVKVSQKPDYLTLPYLTVIFYPLDKLVHAS